MTPDERTLLAADVAKLLRISEMTVYRLMDSGQLPAIRIGRLRRIPESAYREFLESGREETDLDTLRRLIENYLYQAQQMVIELTSNTPGRAGRR